MSQREGLVIGIDGGGSRCRVAARIPGGPVRLAEGGPANVTSDFVEAMAVIRAAISTVSAGTPVRSIHLGLAGVTGRETATRVEQTLAAEFPAAAVRATGDQITMLAGALGERTGAVAGIGTGSFVIRQSRGAVFHVGGRGLVLGDQASGAWLGLRLMQEIMLAHDGFRPLSDLGRAVRARHGDDAGRMIAFARDARPADFAALAPGIVAAATDGDAMAAELVTEGAAYLVRALEVVGLEEDEPLCLTGGLGPAYGRWLPPQLAARIVPPGGTALDGALFLAERGQNDGP